MNVKSIVTVSVAGGVFAVILAVVFLYGFSFDKGNTPQKDLEFLSDITPVNITHQGQGRIILTTGNTIFETFVYSGDAKNRMEEGKSVYSHLHLLLKHENEDLYRKIGVSYEPHNSVFVVPIFTITAYGEPGFYSYYNGDCDTSCLTDIPIRYELPTKFETSENSIKTLKLLGYPYITDIEIDKNPEILSLFDKVIVLHNEYVTRTEFEAITNHPKVIYLHPNALFAEIEVDYENDTISLVRGHGYPDAEIKNGFDWEFDNTYPYEYDTNCNNWEFYEIDNGMMLNCYPENVIYQDKELLKSIKDY